MHLPLPDADLPALALSVPSLEFADVRFQFVEVVEAVVGDADGADEAGALGFDEREPGAVAGGGAAVGGVDQVSGFSMSQILRGGAVFATDDAPVFVCVFLTVKSKKGGGGNLRGKCSIIRSV